jgi:hypothetical protein
MYDPLTKRYLTDMKTNRWKRYTHLNGTVTEANDTPKRMGENDRDSICANPATVADGQGGYDRCAVFLNESTEKIIVIPPINGNIELYNRFKSYILTFTNPKNIVFIFSPGLFHQTEVEQNRQIFYDILSLKYPDVNPQTPPLPAYNIYMLTDYTTNSISIGCTLSPSGILLNLCEPTYILYTYKRLLNDTPINGVIFTAAAQNENDLPISSNLTKLDPWGLYKHNGTSKGSIAFPVNTSTASPMLSNGKYPYRVIDLYSSVEYETNDYDNNIPYTKDTSIAVVYNLRNIPPIQAQKESLYPDRFKAYGQTAVGNLPDKPIQLGLEIFDIRNPTDAVIDDWKNQRFTQSEADYLNSLNLRPIIMEQLFPGMAGDTLEKILYSVVATGCFSDTSLPNQKCKELEQIIGKIMNHFIQNELDIAGMPQNEEREAANRSRLWAQRAQEEVDTMMTDLGVTSESLANYTKNPFDQGKLSYWPENDDTRAKGLNQLIEPALMTLYNGNKWIVKVKAKQRNNSKVKFGYIGTKKDKREEAVRELNGKLAELSSYSGFEFDPLSVS